MEWRLKSCSLWLVVGDRNTTFFHKQARAWLWKNNVKEIFAPNGDLLKNFEEIKSVSLTHFVDLYFEIGESSHKKQLPCWRTSPS
jgi:hypothetical protein